MENAVISDRLETYTLRGHTHTHDVSVRWNSWWKVLQWINPGWVGTTYFGVDFVNCLGFNWLVPFFQVVIRACYPQTIFFFKEYIYWDCPAKLSYKNIIKYEWNINVIVRSIVNWLDLGLWWEHLLVVSRQVVPSWIHTQPFVCLSFWYIWETRIVVRCSHMTS